ncbi:unnamed protein product [Xylocopa violacea]|uniref:Uncharacterized protein n=1 Tax=Xylocopa violacea TaxID=135666 RepID=A0ABP1NK78_XYLVO
MRAFVASLLVVSLIAASASASVKRLEKRGLIAGNGNSHGFDESGGVTSQVTFEGQGAPSSSQYLPPVSSVSVIKKPYPVSSVSVPTYNVQSVPSYSNSLPAPSYGVPALTPAPSYNVHVPVPSYTPSVSVPVPSYAPSVSLPVPSYTHSVSAQVPSFSVPVAASVPSYSGHVSAPSYSGSVSLPSSSYGVPSLSSVPVYSASVPSQSLAVPQPVSVGSSVNNGVSVGLASVPSTSYGVPSAAVSSVPSASVSFTSASYKVPSGYAPESGLSAGLSVGQFSVPSKSYGVPSPVVHGGGLAADYSVGSVGSVSSSHNLGSDTSYDVQSTSVQLEQDNGYSYPVPSKKLII